MHGEALMESTYRVNGILALESVCGLISVAIVKPSY